MADSIAGAMLMAYWSEWITRCSVAVVVFGCAWSCKLIDLIAFILVGLYSCSVVLKDTILLSITADIYYFSYLLY